MSIYRYIDFFHQQSFCGQGKGLPGFSFPWGFFEEAQPNESRQATKATKRKSFVFTSKTFIQFSRKIKYKFNAMGRKPEGKTEKAFKHFGKKLDGMIDDLGKLKDRAKEKYPDQFKEIKKNAEKLKEEVKELKEKNKDKWDVVEDKISKAGKEIKEAFKVAFSKEKE